MWPTLCWCKDEQNPYSNFFESPRAKWDRWDYNPRFLTCQRSRSDLKKCDSWIWCYFINVKILCLLSRINWNKIKVCTCKMNLWEHMDSKCKKYKYENQYINSPTSENKLTNIFMYINVSYNYVSLFKPIRGLGPVLFLEVQDVIWLIHRQLV